MKQIFVILFSTVIYFTYGQTPVAKHGMLKVVGSHVVNKNNEKISLAGNSLFTSCYDWDGGTFYRASVVNHLATEWETSIVRAAMGSTHLRSDARHDDGYIADLAYNANNPNNKRETELDKVNVVVEAAINQGIYVIIDWHSHEAEVYEAEAIEFFTAMAQKYKNTDNVIFEIYNEPDNKDQWGNEYSHTKTQWSTVKNYAEKVIAAIRGTGAKNLIVVGTPHWCGGHLVGKGDYPNGPADNPISGYDNIAYTLHFYAGSHKIGPNVWNDYSLDALAAMNKGLAIFVTEWGAVNADGNGSYDENSTNKWMNFLKENYISHVNWSISDKNEGASVISKTNSTNVDVKASRFTNWNNLSDNGKKIRNIIKYWNVPPVPINPNPIGNDSNVNIYAKGNCGGEEMQLSINGSVVRTWPNVSSSEQNYSYTYNGGTINTIKIAFTNDGGGSCGDLNLYVNKVKIGNTTYETETAATRAEGCGNAEWLWCNGYFIFNNLSSNPEPPNPEPPVSNSKVINVYARGNCGGEEMQLSINGSVEKTWGNVSSSEQNYSYTYNGGAINTIKIAFTNDGGGSCGDLNLYVNKLVIGNTTLETENSATRAEGCGNAEWLWCNGHFLFSNLNLKTIAKSEQGILTLFPNPLTTNSLNINFSGLKETTKVQVTIYSIDGAEMYSNSVMSSGSIQLTDIPDLDSGVYMVRTTANNFQQHAKLNIQ